MPPYSILKTKETQTALIDLCSDKIVRVVFKKNMEITPPHVQENFEAYNFLVDGANYAFIYSTEDISVVYTHEGLNYSRQNSHKAFPKICTAVVIGSLAHRLIANFYNSIFNHQFPYKVFDNHKEAETWCLQLTEKYRKNL